MSLDFYLFDVSQGQSAAGNLPNGSWCLFDAGGTPEFSPVQWIMSQQNQRQASIFKATISHFHGDHMADHIRLLNVAPNHFTVVKYDDLYLHDVAASSSKESFDSIMGFIHRYGMTYKQLSSADYGEASLCEMALPVSVARAIGGQPKSCVNNASIVTRIDCHGNSILVCGDMEKEGWDYALSKSTDAAEWRQLVSNIDVLVAPHHGHKSGFSETLMTQAKPAVVLASVASKDPSVDTRYSDPDRVRGLILNETTHYLISTRRKDNGCVRVNISSPAYGTIRGNQTWYNV